jgi:hypothetical protein
MARKPHEGWTKPISDFSIEHGAHGVLMQVTGSTDDAGVQTTRIAISTPGATGALQFAISEGRELVVVGAGPAAGALLEALSELAGQLRVISK